ncbi:MAG: hypothetical protein OWR62_10985 [Sulfobacillus thermotolerans]|nr:hypothetical protein [Sulfobacillus thermotolerans]
MTARMSRKGNAFVAKRWNRSPLYAESTTTHLTNMGLPSLAVMRRHVALGRI